MTAKLIVEGLSHHYPDEYTGIEVHALDDINLEVKEGELLLFPSYLPHKVAKNESSEDRIVISFNVGIK